MSVGQAGRWCEGQGESRCWALDQYCVSWSRGGRIPESVHESDWRLAQQLGTADLGHQTRRIEIDSLVDNAVTVEEKHRDNWYPKCLAGRWKAVEFTEIGAQQVELDNHRAIGDVVAHVVVALIGKRRPGGAVVTHHLIVAIENLASRDDLVTRMPVERAERAVEVLGHFGVHVLADDVQPALPQIMTEHRLPLSAQCRH